MDGLRKVTNFIDSFPTDDLACIPVLPLISAHSAVLNTIPHTSFMASTMGRASWCASSTEWGWWGLRPLRGMQVNQGAVYKDSCVQPTTGRKTSRYDQSARQLHRAWYAGFDRNESTTGKLADCRCKEIVSEIHSESKFMFTIDLAVQ